MEMEWILDLLVKVGAGGIIMAILMHFLKKKKYNKEVDNQQVNNDSIVQNYYSKILEDVKKLLQDERVANDKKIQALRKELEDEINKRKELETELTKTKEMLNIEREECDAKIRELKRELYKRTNKINSRITKHEEKE